MKYHLGPVPRTMLVLFGLTLGSAVLSHTGATGVVKERMDAMGKLGSGMKALSTAFESGADPRVVADKARVIQQHSGQNLIDFFPVGSLQPASEARPEIWQNWAAFTSIAFELEDLAQQLTQETSSTQSRILFKEIARTCARCHKDFRIKK